MYHSINISGKNTYTEWGLVPTSRPHVEPPAVKTSYVDLPSSHGRLDYTELLLGEVPYGQRTGSWEFTLRPGATWASVYSSILAYLHGKEHTVVLEDDPNFQYTGRLEVSSWKSDQNRSIITIDYDLAPFKYGIHSTADEDWQWDDLFDNVIYYGTFDVDGSKFRTFINQSSNAVTPTYTVSRTMSVKFDGVTYTLITGDNKNENLALQPGDNEMQFIGTGHVVVAYREVSL